MMKNIITTISLLFFLAQNSLCQVNDTIYLDVKFKEVNKEEATYYRVSKSHPDGSSKLFVQTYYLSGQIKSNASCYSRLCVQMDGYYISYYANGVKEEEGKRIKNAKSGTWNKWYDNAQQKETAAYAMGSKTGLWKTWYKNGQQKEEFEAVGDWNTVRHLRNKLINYWDSTGKQLIVEGNGEMTYYHDDMLTISSMGQYKNGFKIGIWKGFTEEKKLKYEEIYKKGKVTGLSWNNDGKKFQYGNLEDQPGPEGGMAAFYKHVQKTMKYPRDARRFGIQGRVFVEFEVDEDGELITVKTIKGIGGGCDKEAERVVKNSPKWNPGKQRGQPVKVRMILPITFKLS
jgi:TonB family protein